jgi:hypothetical protein
MEALIKDLTSRTIDFKEAAHHIFAGHESSKSRIFVLESSYQSLGALNLRQDDLMRQAFRCVELGVYRAAHVMAWAAFMDFLEDKLQSDGLKKVRSVRPGWKGTDITTMREYVAERQLVEVTQDIGLCSKNQVKALVGLLNRRNECAHPSEYYPALNETLGYISELLQRIQSLIPKTL